MAAEAILHQIDNWSVAWPAVVVRIPAAVGSSEAEDIHRQLRTDVAAVVAADIAAVVDQCQELAVAVVLLDEIVVVVAAAAAVVVVVVVLVVESAAPDLS